MNQQIEKMTKLPQQPWESVQLDFCGPFPSGEYAMVLTDQSHTIPKSNLSDQQRQRHPRKVKENIRNTRSPQESANGQWTTV